MVIKYEKKIFIGQSGEEAVYYNTRTKEALVADKSALLNTEGARRTNRAIIPLILLLHYLVEVLDLRFFHSLLRLD
ncbi:hypothetical protein STRDD11_02635 [Streptococcus sp. DD11]|nr:hypothetical protein STRDD11_02635 [Streptococcus sp. DD11]